MGYYTFYNVNAEVPMNFSKDEALEMIKKVNDFLSERDIPLNSHAFEPYDYNKHCFMIVEDEMKWYEYVDDMKEVSLLVPDVKFTVYGNGEESEDIWYHYFLNGQDCYCPVKITFPDNDLW